MPKIFFKWLMFSEGFGAVLALLAEYDIVRVAPKVLLVGAGTVLTAFAMGWMARHAWD